jgi:hypothetical protein
VDGLELLRDSEKMKYCIVRCVCEANIRYCKVRVSALHKLRDREVAPEQSFSPQTPDPHR